MAITVLGKDAIIPTDAEAIAAMPDVGTVTRTVDPATISEIARTRIQRHRQALVERFGEDAVKRTDPIYAAGTTVNELGVRNFRHKRQELERLPTGDVACFDVLKKVMAEERMETELNAEWIEPGNVPGTLIVNGSPYRVTEKAMRHLFSLVDAPEYASAHAPHASSAVFAQMVNDYMPRKERRLIAAFRRRGIKGADADLPEIYRFATKNYTPFDVDKVLVTLLHTCLDLLKGWRTEVKYDGDQVIIDMMAMPDTVVDLAAGDVFKIGLRLRANDVREGGVVVELLVWRNRCLNLIVIGTLKTELMNLRHTGAMEDIYTMLSTAMPKAELAFAEFRHDWGIARSERILTPELPPHKFFEGLAASKILALPGDTGAIKTALINAWLKEPGEDRASVVNAVTRAVHEQFAWRDEFGSNEVEAQAGRLLTDKFLISKVEAALAKSAKTGKKDAVTV